MLIKNGTLITSTDTFQADILVEDEKISQIGQNLQTPGAQVVDAAGKFILPGGVDPHTHFDLPMFDTVSSDDHYTGHKAAAFGGTTTAIDFVSFDFPTLHESVEAWHAKAEKAAIDYSFHMNLTHFDEQIAAEIPPLPGDGHHHAESLHRLQQPPAPAMMAASSKPCASLRENGMLIMLHAENGDVIDTLIAEALAAGHTTPEWHARTRPAWGAVEATLRACSLAAQADAPAVHRPYERGRRSGHAQVCPRARRAR